MLAPSNPQLDQGPTRLCGPFCIEAVQDAAGRHVGAREIYEQIKGEPFVPPGFPCTFPELQQGIRIAARMGRCDLDWWDGDGGISSPDVVEEAARLGFAVIIGVWMGDLLADQDYFHYLLIHTIEGNGDDTSVIVIDSYAREDGGRERYSWKEVAQGMIDNWTGPEGLDAVGYRLCPR